MCVLVVLVVVMEGGLVNASVVCRLEKIDMCYNKWQKIIYNL